MKIKTISRKGWGRILSGKEYISKQVRPEFDGVVALYYLEKVKKPLIKTMNGERVVIADDDYYWMQIGPRNANYWMTVMFDRSRKMVQWYFDVTLRNEIDAPEGPYFVDLYLDLVVLPNGDMIVLDEDEILEGYQKGEFGEEDYKMAFRTVDELKSKIAGNVDKLKTFTEDCFFTALNEVGWK